MTMMKENKGEPAPVNEAMGRLYSSFSRKETKPAPATGAVDRLFSSFSKKDSEIPETRADKLKRLMDLTKKVDSDIESSWFSSSDNPLS